MKQYNKLLVWKRAIEFVQLVYTFSKKFSKDETYGITSQFRRAAVSVAANIAEWRGKATDRDRDFLRFLYIAQGSLNESQSYIELITSLHFLNESEVLSLERKRGEVGYLLFRLIRKIEGKK